MKPAYHIPLTQEELALIGEIAAIQNQIDWLMNQTVLRLLHVSQVLANRLMGSTSQEANAGIWFATISENCKSEHLQGIAIDAQKSLKALVEMRNDFIHGHFVTQTQPGLTHLSTNADDTAKLGGVSISTRVKSGKTRLVSELKSARDLAAMISCKMAYIDDCVRFRRESNPETPWHDRVFGE